MTPPARRAFWLALVLCPTFVIPSLGLNGCGGTEGSPTSPPPPASTPAPPAANRDRLTVTELFGATPPGTVHNAYYQPLGEVRATSNALCGTLHFAETRMATTHPDSDWRGGGLTLFPAFSLPVVARDDWLIPLERDIVLSGHGGGGRCTVEVPLMSGAGGNHVLMLPSGLTVIRFMDADDFEVRHHTRAAEMYRSSCR